MMRDGRWFTVHRIQPLVALGSGTVGVAMPAGRPAMTLFQELLVYIVLIVAIGSAGAIWLVLP
jgi:hypothetical protein